MNLKDGTYARLLSKLARADVLVVDDWALKPLRDQERHDFLEILEGGFRSEIKTIQRRFAPIGFDRSS